MQLETFSDRFDSDLDHKSDQDRFSFRFGYDCLYERLNFRFVKLAIGVSVNQFECTKLESHNCSMDQWCRKSANLAGLNLESWLMFHVSSAVKIETIGKFCDASFRNFSFFRDGRAALESRSLVLQVLFVR